MTDLNSPTLDSQRINPKLTPAEQLTALAEQFQKRADCARMEARRLNATAQTMEARASAYIAAASKL